MKEEFDFDSIKNKALEQLKSGKSLLGKDGAFAPLLESILNATLEGDSLFNYFILWNGIILASV